MFCPGCGTQNELKQGYCRQCGQALSALRLSLEGTAERSLEKLKGARELLNAGSATLFVFSLIGLAIWLVGLAISEPNCSNIAVINLLLGLCVGAPLILVGNARLKRAANFLAESQDGSTIQKAERSEKLLTTDLDRESPRLPEQASATDHTTLSLKDPEGAQRKPS